MPRQFKIGLWGTAHAGKTTYLAMLYHSLLSKHDEWTVTADEDSRQFVEKAFEAIMNNRTFPEKTVESRLYSYTVSHKHQPKQFTLEFRDAPGELYEEY